MASITLKNITKVYDQDSRKRDEEVEAVSNVNLKIEDKEFIVLVGPSGCGKSTTLRMIAGLEDITSGELYVDDVLVNEVEPKDRNMAMVFQDYALYPHMNVYDNMAFGLKQHKVPKDQIDKKVREVAEILDITEYLKRKPKQLSGGQRQRVAIGRALVREPAVFLMDEPLSNLDAKLRNQMRSEIIKLHKQVDTTFVYVTHDQTEAMTLGDRIVVMKDGVVQQIGTPQEVFDNPVNSFVGGFIGTPQMNFIEGELIRENDDYYIEIHGFRTKVNEEKAKAMLRKDVKSGKVIAGIRPDYLHISDDGMKATIDIFERMGTVSHLHVYLDDQEIVMIVPTNEINKLGINSSSTGKEIKLTYTVENVNLFDPVTQKNLEF